MIALVVTGLLSLAMFPLLSPQLFSQPSRSLGHIVLVVIRSTPEYILAFVLRQLWGPSMLRPLSRWRSTMAGSSVT
ncbi:MAG: hypothetical protein CL566_08420 [Alphaproteobacteria bacterium]|nr:hypothetical protein [Alphaproteobacteria bacterium]|tara:strand:- start:963 stop:1190 length:228 start_codon:yes stop_codon:yes gene_type:complete